MTTRERAERNRSIVEARLFGATCDEVASAHGISPRHVRRICAEGADHVDFQLLPRLEPAADSQSPAPQRGLSELRRAIQVVGERRRLLGACLRPPADSRSPS